MLKKLLKKRETITVVETADDNPTYFLTGTAHEESPHKFIIGEIRGNETRDLIEAMKTAHPGTTMATINRKNY